MANKNVAKKPVARRNRKNIDKGGSFWLCKCSCGNETIIRGSDLKNKKHCGCKNKTTRKDLTGQKFGKLTVEEYLLNIVYN